MGKKFWERWKRDQENDMLKPRKTVSKGNVISKGESHWMRAEKYPLDLTFESSQI